ncbi:apoptosis inhibitor 5-like [Tubulanus polymorphus]|uniref:apoptosis inhibitor 5-like n=1 Tax=Tubulanus polymorphus TaxID=672921 RepID=UPI003DA2F8E8
MVTVDQLYDYCNILDEAKDKISEHETEYLAILEGVKAGNQQKKLASQLIARYFKHFPKLAEQAINAHIDLCEDVEVEIRKHAIKDLPHLCKDMPEVLSRIADVLTQLLQSEDQQELLLVQSSLLTLFKADIKEALTGLFQQILNGDDVVRDRAIKFLCRKVRSLPDEIFTKEVEELILTESKKILQDCTGEEFHAFMKLLSGLKITASVQGRQGLVDIIVEQSDLDSEFNPADPDGIDRLVSCVKQATHLLSKNVPSSKFVAYICDHVLPSLSDVPSVEGTDTQLEMLRLFAELVTHCGDLEKGIERLTTIYDKLLEYMPLPPTDEKENGNLDSTDEPKFQFSQVECLMYAFHQIGRKHQEFLTAEANVDRLKDFKLRLNYFARGSQSYFKQLKTALTGKSAESLKSDENKIKVAAFKVMSNINQLIKDLLHVPPSYKCVISLSWKPVTKAVSAPASATAGTKRLSGGAGDSDATKNKMSKQQDRQLYAPPGGKYSEKAGNYREGGRGGRGFRGRGRGGYRGRGSFRSDYY